MSVVALATSVLISARAVALAVVTPATAVAAAVWASPVIYVTYEVENVAKASALARFDIAVAVRVLISPALAPAEIAAARSASAVSAMWSAVVT